MPIRGATIRDVAHRAGVSVGTASKAFNNKGKLAAETRRRVLEAAAELNFAPNALIRSLQRGRTFTIGVLTWNVRTDPSRDITMQLLKGITEGIADANCDTLLYSHLEDRPADRMAATLLDGRADGLIVAPNLLTPAGWKGLISSGIPVVTVYRRDMDDIGSVGVDNQAGILAAVDHLVELGHRRIAFYASYPTFDFRERGDAYLLGISRRDLPHDPAIFNLDPEMTPEIFCERILSLPDCPTALIAGDDADALVLMEVLRGRGIRIPEDISVVGFDDTTAASIVSPGLTTVRQPATEVGRAAAKMVNALIQGASPAECRSVLPVEFVVRGTTCPAPCRS